MQTQETIQERGAIESAAMDLIADAREKLRLSRFTTPQGCDFVQLSRKDLSIIDHLLIEFMSILDAPSADMAAIERRIKTGDLDPNGNEWEVE